MYIAISNDTAGLPCLPFFLPVVTGLHCTRPFFQDSISQLRSPSLRFASQTLEARALFSHARTQWQDKKKKLTSQFRCSTTAALDEENSQQTTSKEEEEGFLHRRPFLQPLARRAAQYTVCVSRVAELVIFSPAHVSRRAGGGEGVNLTLC